MKWYKRQNGRESCRLQLLPWVRHLKSDKRYSMEGCIIALSPGFWVCVRGPRQSARAATTLTPLSTIDSIASALNLRIMFLVSCGANLIVKAYIQEVGYLAMESLISAPTTSTTLLALINANPRKTQYIFSALIIRGMSTLNRRALCVIYCIC
ncbi:hypothetical protein RSOLAG1IB_10823 [Rhizoctonia solani AG-1 IB]|uniref:Uncharacterized protein n=1 Tax=Thanatephorus cucumeris (strain AG1-IB / isolate 7/3/14) TaxID=1108050 RepID=A0A0B7G0P3_THACB|nr:hypothetical protein RSOLAG1IB_10823 [Rhizoctonia solani AG-1 IB]